MTRFRSEVPKNLFRLPCSVTQKMDKWLQDLSSQMKATGGYKLPKSYIVRGVLDAVMKLDVDVSEVRTEEELSNRFLKAIKKYR